MAYRSSVEFLEQCNPRMVEQSAHEFRRLHKLLDSVDDAFVKASSVDWVSEGRDRYVKRLSEAEELAQSLSASFRKAGTALSDYAEALTTAKSHFEDGKAAEGSLADVIAREAQAITPTARAAEPMRQWEDLRGTTGILDWGAELTVDVDAIREDAERYYDKTSGHYADAKRVEGEARTTCLRLLKSAYRALPDFRGDFPDPGRLLKQIPALRGEAQEARDDPYVQLPGTGTKADELGVTHGRDNWSPVLERIRTRVDGLGEAQGNNYWLPSNDDEGRRQYIGANKELIRAAAQDSGLPPEMVAGIAWQEVEGDPGVQDDVVIGLREYIPGQDPDQTSVGPIAIQIRRSAEVLGYDPDNLTEEQHRVVIGATRDPTYNIFIASEYLAQLKAESEYADVPPEKMTEAQMQDLAARYNGGPYHESADAQAYGRGFINKLDEAKRAMR